MKHFTLFLIAICLSLVTFGQVNPITGASSVCVSFTTTLTDLTPGGIWSSSNSAVATIGSSTGIVTGLGGGTATITYTVGSSRATKVITVNQLPAVITGSAPVCAGLTVTLRDASAGGTWTSSNTAVGSISTAGVVTGRSAGNTTITYQLSTGCYRTSDVTVNPVPAAITGAGGVCQGSSITLSDATPGGTWTSSNTRVSIGVNTGIATGSTLGSAVITYKITTTGCTATANVTVTSVPSVIFGTFSICAGTTTTLNDGTTGGKWSSSNTSIATIGSTTGLTSGIAPGTCTISYAVNGCATTKTFSVTAPPPITGSNRVCKSATTTLTDPVSGGIWTSTNTTIATIGSTTGIVTGKTPGVATISYTKSGCAATLSMIVPDTAKAIAGTNHVCEGATTTLTDPTLYGFWSSSNTAIATVGSITGIVTGVAAGNGTITYSTGCGTAKTMAFTTNVQPSAISGPSAVCTSSTITLTNTASGGVWTSSSNTIATAGSSTGIVSGVGSGNATITYTLGNCSSNKAIVVDLLLTPGSLTGTTTVCATATTTLTNAGHTGTWSSSNASVASIGSTGVVSGIAAGTATISFTQSNNCMTTNTTTLVTVNPLPNAGSITGTNHVCEASTTTLNNTATSGVWSSSNTAVASVGSATGIVTGVAAGNAIISYTHTNSCGTARSTMTMTVNPLPQAGTITGTAFACQGATSTLNDAATGGVWSSSNTGIATVNSTGIVTAVATGTATISYSVTNSCGTAVAVTTFTVNPLPNAGSITGSNTVCQSATTTLNNTATSGVWSSSNTGIATIGSTGIVTGVAAGTMTISYTHTNSCGTARSTKAMTVNPLPNAGTITGTPSACAGSTSALGDATTGGVWSSSNTGIATVNSTGVVTAVAAGNATISYSVTNVCGTAVANATFTVNPLPDAGSITGSNTVCEASTTVLNNTATSGVWSSSNASVATVDATGIVTGVAAGNVTISYTHTNSCGTARSTKTMTVNPLPHAGTISGTTTICAGSTSTLSTTGTGGAWSSSNTGAATVNSTGVVTAVAAGNATISYNVTNTCGTDIATSAITVNALPDAGSITGSNTVCAASTITLSNTATAGVWSSSNTSVATIGSTGTVTGVVAGTATISYTHTNSCGTARTTAAITVNPLPNAGTISGTTTICESNTSSLTTTGTGGVWSTSNAGAAGVSNAGVVTAVSAGTATISYTVANSCGTDLATAAITINPAPFAGTITGSSTVCEASTLSLSNTATAGSWSSSNDAIATVGSTGSVTGIAPGSVTISYIHTNSCGTATATAPVTVNPLPHAGTITGTRSVCEGATTTLASTLTGGTWSSSNPSAATIGSTGIVSGLTRGTTTIAYNVTNSCGTALTTTTFSVNAMPAAITGVTNTCLGSSSLLRNTVGGGVWTSNNTSVASIESSTGLMTGVAAGSATITYTIAGTCAVTTSVTVGDIAPITGSSEISLSLATPFSDAVAGGTWSSSNTSVASVDASGNVTGVAAGTATITYTATSGCIATLDVTSAALRMSGPCQICMGPNPARHTSYPGGVWTSSNTSIATVDPTTGVITGVHTGVTTISYTISASQRTSMTMTVNTQPASLTGNANACPGSTTSLFTNISGGVWSSSDTTIATAVQGSFGGVITGVNVGTAVITYMLASGCYADTMVTVNPLPAAITGNPQICQGSTTVLSNTTPGGTWIQNNTNVIVGASTGVVSGLHIGTALITYTSAAGCRAIQSVTVNALPSVIYGSTTVAPGRTVVLHSGTDGGVWSSGNVNIATCAGTGMSAIMGGVALGSTCVSYTMPSTGCFITTTVAVTMSGGRQGDNSAMEQGAQAAVTEIAVYPNPTSTPQLTVATPVSGMLIVYAMDGKELQHYELTEGKNNIELPTGIAGGTYLTIFKGTDGSTTTNRIVYKR